MGYNPMCLSCSDLDAGLKRGLDAKSFTMPRKIGYLPRQALLESEKGLKLRMA